MKFTSKPFTINVEKTNKRGKVIPFVVDVPAIQFEADVEVVEPTPEPEPEPEPTPEPPIETNFDKAVKQWETNMLNAGAQWMGSYVKPGFYFDPDANAWLASQESWGNSVQFYDGPTVFANIGVYTKQYHFHDFAVRLFTHFTTRDEQYGTIPYGEMGAVRDGLKKQGRWVYATACELFNDYDRIKDLCENSCYTAYDGWPDILAASDARSLALILNAYVTVERNGIEAGTPYWDMQKVSSRVEAYVDTLGSRNWELFYMLGMLGCEIHRSGGSETFKKSLCKKIADFIFAKALRSDGSLFYGTGDHQEASITHYNELHLIIAPAMHYGGYTQVAELLFQYGVEKADLYTHPKSFCQNYLYSIDYVREKKGV